MALNNVAAALGGLYSETLDPGGEVEAIEHVLTELQGLKVSVADGAGPSTDIAVASIGTTDTIVQTLYFPVATGNVTGVQAIPSSITSGGNIQSTTDTTGGFVVVVWFDKA